VLAVRLFLEKQQSASDRQVVVVEERQQRGAASIAKRATSEAPFGVVLHIDQLVVARRRCGRSRCAAVKYDIISHQRIRIVVEFCFDVFVFIVTTPTSVSRLCERR
jgi:hypothetical protein